MIKAFRLTQPIRERPWLGYVIAIVAVAFSLGLREALGDAALRFPFVIFLPPVVLTTFVGGLAPGIACAILAGVVADVTLIAPAGTVIPKWPDGWIAMGFYGITVALDIALISALATAFGRAASAENELRDSNLELEARIADRTAELERQISERETAEAQIRHMQKMESVGQLTGGIAHDFNNMLGVVMGSLEMARRRIDDPPRLISHLDSAEEGAKRASQLVVRLLAYSRRQPLEPTSLDANRLVGGMTELLRRTIGEAIRIDTILSGGLWRCFADVAQVENALLNLAVNARDAMPDGGRLTLETRNADLDDDYVRKHPAVAAGQYVAIIVTDTGTGMPREIIDRIFDPFFTTKGTGKGSGLGLSQVYGFVTQSGGHIDVRSEVGRGTSIQLYLPRHTATDATRTPPKPLVQIPTARSSESVLVVEDEDAVRRVSVGALRDLGYRVVHAADAKQALNVLAVQPSFDVLFTDVVMPEMNGRQLADAARAMLPSLRVIYTTGYARNTILQDSESDPTISILPKPFTISQLAVKVRDVLDHVSPP